MSHPLWHHISWPFKPQGEPEIVHTMPPEAQNIVTAIVLNERVVRVIQTHRGAPSRLLGSFILSEIFISRFTRFLSSHANTLTVTVAEPGCAFG
jgi:hypothetical protein